MSKTLRVSEDTHELVMRLKRDDETVDEALVRLLGGPHPDQVAGVISEATAEDMRRAAEEASETARESVRETDRRFDRSSSGADSSG